MCFRDTAHGLLAWAVATLLNAMLASGALRAALSGAIDAGCGEGEGDGRRSQRLVASISATFGGRLRDDVARPIPARPR